MALSTLHDSNGIPPLDSPTLHSLSHVRFLLELFHLWSYAFEFLTRSPLTLILTLVPKANLPSCRWPSLLNRDFNMPSGRHTSWTDRLTSPHGQLHWIRGNHDARAAYAYVHTCTSSRAAAVRNLPTLASAPQQCIVLACTNFKQFAPAVDPPHGARRTASQHGSVVAAPAHYRTSCMAKRSS